MDALNSTEIWNLCSVLGSVLVSLPVFLPPLSIFQGQQKLLFPSYSVIHTRGLPDHVGCTDHIYSTETENFWYSNRCLMH
jgi:hypothetical protein